MSDLIYCNTLVEVRDAPALDPKLGDGRVNWKHGQVGIVVRTPWNLRKEVPGFLPGQFPKMYLVELCKGVRRGRVVPLPFDWLTAIPIPDFDGEGVEPEYMQFLYRTMLTSAVGVDEAIMAWELKTSSLGVRDKLEDSGNLRDIFKLVCRLVDKMRSQCSTITSFYYPGERGDRLLWKVRV